MLPSDKVVKLPTEREKTLSQSSTFEGVRNFSLKDAPEGMIYDGTTNGIKQHYEESRKVSSMGEDTMLSTLLNKLICDQGDIKRDIVESEKRTARNIELSEDRMEKRQDQIVLMLNKLDEKIDSHQKEISSKLDTDIKYIYDKVDSSNKAIWGIAIATIIGIAAMVVSIIVAK